MSSGAANVPMGVSAPPAESSFHMQLLALLSTGQITGELAAQLMEAKIREMQAKTKEMQAKTKEMQAKTKEMEEKTRQMEEKTKQEVERTRQLELASTASSGVLASSRTDAYRQCVAEGRVRDPADLLGMIQPLRNVSQCLDDESLEALRNDSQFAGFPEITNVNRAQTYDECWYFFIKVFNRQGQRHEYPWQRSLLHLWLSQTKGVRYKPSYKLTNDCANTLTVLEIKPRSTFERSKGQIMAYMAHLLYTKARRFMFAFTATDVQLMVFYAEVQPNGEISYSISTPIALFPEEPNQLCGLMILHWASIASGQTLGENVPLILGPYTTADFLSQGKTAHVYRGRNDPGSTEFVIKLLKSKTDDLAAREVAVLSAIRNRALQDHVQLHGLPVAELISPYALKITPYCRDEFQLSVAVVRQVLQVLFYAHAVGWVHRDVRPANIRLGPLGAVLLDWGFAAACGADTSYCGTLQYAARNVLYDLLKHRVPDRPHPRHDLESLVLIVWACTRNGLMKMLNRAGNYIPDLWELWQTQLGEPELEAALRLAYTAAETAAGTQYANEAIYTDLAGQLFQFAAIKE